MGCIISQPETNCVSPFSDYRLIAFIVRFFSAIFIILPLPVLLFDILITINSIFVLTILIKVCYAEKAADISSYRPIFYFSSILGRVVSMSSIGLIFAKATSLNGHLIGFVSKLAAGSGQINHLVAGFSIFVLFMIIHGILSVWGKKYIMKLESDIDTWEKKILESIAPSETGSENETLGEKIRKQLQATKLSGKKYEFYFTMSEISDFIYGNGKLRLFIIAFGFIGVIIIVNLLRIESINEAVAPYIEEASLYSDVIVPYISLAIGAGLLVMFHAILLSAAMGIGVKRMVSNFF
jgi:flagellar biosynthesis component FlhA